MVDQPFAGQRLILLDFRRDGLARKANHSMSDEPARMELINQLVTVSEVLTRSRTDQWHDWVIRLKEGPSNWLWPRVWFGHPHVLRNLVQRYQEHS